LANTVDHLTTHRRIRIENNITRALDCLAIPPIHRHAYADLELHCRAWDSLAVLVLLDLRCTRLACTRWLDDLLAAIEKLYCGDVRDAAEVDRPPRVGLLLGEHAGPAKEIRCEIAINGFVGRGHDGSVRALSAARDANILTVEAVEMAPPAVGTPVE
jgi:hypothetical protein